MKIAMNWVWCLTPLTLAMRFYNLSLPAYVCWDETHFVKMATQYLNHTYFMDVHPPLGKMLIALAGHITGYNRNSTISNPGEAYVTEGENKTHYYGMRALSAITGSLVIPMMYGTVEILSGSSDAALFSSILLMFDPGLITLTQYILLDPLLLFFMAASIYLTVKFSSVNSSGRYSIVEVTTKKSLKYVVQGVGDLAETKRFSPMWCTYLIMSGICLGCMLSIKFVGLFTVCFIGLWTVSELWNMLGDVKGVTLDTFARHFMARALCLIVLPLCVYVTSYAIHYELLDHSGTGDGFHSSTFQSCIKGNELYNASMSPNIAYGSVVTLKHHHVSSGGYLHSHRDCYPVHVTPFQHQQVTQYHHKDNNNFWEIIKPSQLDLSAAKITGDVSRVTVKSNKVEYIRDGDIVKFRHFRTKHYLSSQRRSAALTKRHQLVSGLPDSVDDIGSNELWRLEIVGSTHNIGNADGVGIMNTAVRVVHVETKCLLHTTLKQLPEWGSYQMEVTCTHHRRDRPRAVWNFERNFHKLIEATPLGPCRMSFFDKFLESHLIMLNKNSMLTPSDGERTSKPWQWPLNYKGQAFTRMGEDDLRVYLLGSPVVYLLNLVVLFAFPVVALVIRVSELRDTPCSMPSGQHSKVCRTETLPETTSRETVSDLSMDCRITYPDISRLLNSCRWFYLGWTLHYFPFFLMSRVLYFHHYYPAFVFSCCLSGCFIDAACETSAAFLSRTLANMLDKPARSRIKACLIGIFAFCVLHNFYLYSPLCYGMTGPLSYHESSVMYGLRVFRQWEI